MVTSQTLWRWVVGVVLGGVEGGDKVVRIRVNVEGESPLMIKLT